MAPKGKPDLLNRQGSPSKSGSKTESYDTKKQSENQLSRKGKFIRNSQQWITTFLVQLACWETLPAALAVLLLGGFRHD